MSGSVTHKAIAIDTAFINLNGNLGDDVPTSNMEEGHIQRLVFTKADVRYLIADSSKVGKRDLCTFYHLRDLDAQACEPGIDADARAAVEECTNVIC